MVTAIAQFTAKTTNSEKAIYFLSLMSCSINKLKSQMFFTCKKFMFSNLTLKKKYFAPGNGGVGEGGGGPDAPLTPFPYGPDRSLNRFPQGTDNHISTF